MTPDPPLVPDFDRLIRQENRRWTGIGVLLFLLGISLGINGLQAFALRPTLDKLEDTADDTKDAVELLEGRTPLFGEIQATENRAVCLSELNAAALDALAEGLVAVAANDDQALTLAAGRVSETRARLALVATDRDPCRPGG